MATPILRAQAEAGELLVTQLHEWLRSSFLNISVTKAPISTLHSPCFTSKSGAWLGSILSYSQSSLAFCALFELAA